MSEINRQEFSQEGQKGPIRKEIHLPDGNIVELFKDPDNPRKIINYTVRTPKGELLSDEELFTSAGACLKDILGVKRLEENGRWIGIEQTLEPKGRYTFPRHWTEEQKMKWQIRQLLDYWEGEFGETPREAA